VIYVSLALLVVGMDWWTYEVGRSWRQEAPDVEIGPLPPISQIGIFGLGTILNPKWIVLICCFLPLWTMPVKQVAIAIDA
jgi:hypothetical protein